jgi:hypothetical protein
MFPTVETQFLETAFIRVIKANNEDLQKIKLA